MANKLSVAFIGTGIMGAPIAGHILDAGYPVTVNNRTESKAAALIERGAVWADTPADAAANADVVFTMVGYPSEVEELYLAGDGLLACTKPGAVLIDLTTSSPELARDIAEAAQVSGRMAFDCPVTGGESGAIAGTLTAIVGATENDIAPVRDILATFAANICCFDGAGKAAKLANQVSLGACMVGMADAMAFAELSGLDLEKTRQMILGGTGKSGAMESLAPKALDGDYKPGFMVEHFIKDLRLALAYADDRELALPGADALRYARRHWRRQAGHPGHHGTLQGGGRRHRRRSGLVAVSPRGAWCPRGRLRLRRARRRPRVRLRPPPRRGPRVLRRPRP